MAGDAMKCAKCGAFSGDDWTQCEGQCPMVSSPYYDPSWDMNCLIEWVEPYDEKCDITLICRMTKKDAIEAQKRSAFNHKGHVYETDERALVDFMTIHWAREVK